MVQKIMRVCPSCKAEKEIYHFAYQRGRGENYYTCRACDKRVENAFKSKPSDPRFILWERSALNARKIGIEHTIEPEDIPMPNTCKYFGVQLEYPPGKSGRRWDKFRASIDRIDSTKGYVKGNVHVISYLANRMKQDASEEDLIAFAEGVLKIHSKKT